MIVFKGIFETVAVKCCVALFVSNRAGERQLRARVQKMFAGPCHNIQIAGSGVLSILEKGGEREKETMLPKV